MDSYTVVSFLVGLLVLIDLMLGGMWVTEMLYARLVKPPRE